MLGGERQCDRAAARADVDDARALEAHDRREGALDRDLGFGPRHERARVGTERQPAEAPFPEHVRERLAPAAALDECTRGCALGLVQRPIVLRVELDPLDGERMGEQQLGVEPRRVDALAGEVVDGGAQDLADRLTRPTLERASLCVGGERVGELVQVAREHILEPAVTPTRWSVTRFCG